MTDTALKVITRSMRKAGILSKVESPTSDEANDALETLNDSLALYSNDGLLVYEHELESFSATGGTSSYTIGSGGDLNTSRPLSFVSLYCTDSGGVDYPLKSVSDSDYAALTTKSTTGRPRFYYYDGGYPLGTLKLYPAPDQSYTVNVISQKPLTSLATLTTEFDFPPGWRPFVIDTLAIALAPEYGVQVPQETLLTYNAGKAALRRNKAKRTTFDGNTPSSEKNIYTGYA